MLDTVRLHGRIKFIDTSRVKLTLKSIKGGFLQCHANPPKAGGFFVYPFLNRKGSENRIMALYGGIEAGGTKWVCVVGSEPNALQAEATFPTTTPEETLSKAIAFFRSHGKLDAIGIGSFGPVDVNPQSDTWGYITTTPKPGWQNTNVARRVQAELNVPIGFDTDVNAAALGEQRWGIAQGLDTFIYLTVGTGIGGGAMVNGRLVHGLIHPEMGHMVIPHDFERDPFPGSCPYHKDCLEGLAAGPALEARWKQRGETLAPDHPAWALEAHYLALALMNMVCTLSPQRLILGGGVMAQPHLFPMIRRNLAEYLAGYVQSPVFTETLDSYVVPPALGRYAGVAGALVLAQQAAGVY